MFSFKLLKILFLFFVISSCQSKFLKVKNEPKDFGRLEEFDKKVSIKELPPPEDPPKIQEPAANPIQQVAPSPLPVNATPELVVPHPTSEITGDAKGKKIEQQKPVDQSKKPDAKKLVKEKNQLIKVIPPKPRGPDWEDRDGFPEGTRRPLKDPFRVGEKVVHSVKYFKATAGKLTFSIPSMAEVNGKPAYRLYTSLKTEGIFSRFYSVDDWSETLMDFETLIPTVFSLHVKESAQLKEARAYLDPLTLQATYWEEKYTEDKGRKEKKISWTALPFSQNVFSAAFYQRVFNYQVGKKYQFNVANEGKNVMFSAACLRKERIETEAGTFNTVVIKPEFSVGGVFQPSGDIYFWLTDDERKFLVRIESDIKIGTLVTEAISIQP